MRQAPLHPQAGLQGETRLVPTDPPPFQLLAEDHAPGTFESLVGTLREQEVQE